MVTRGRHPKNAINAAPQTLDPEKFEIVEIHKGHRWGAVICRTCGMKEPIWSTPRVPEHNANAIQRFDRRHQHEEWREERS